LELRFEVLTAVTMNNAVFWDIIPQFVPHRKHYFSAKESSRLILCKIDVFTAVAMKNTVFWDIKPSSYLTVNTLIRYRAPPVNAM
jgi:hypothetical protein